MEFDRRYRQLNDAQRKAVDSIDGPVMVIAGPGTGKTELLSVRIANILKKTDTLPESILCLTFTESGAAAMRERLVGIIGKDAYKVAIHTFHSFGTEIISTYREYFYNSALFSPADDLAQYEILKGIFDELDYKNPLATTMNGEYTHLSDARTVISELKRAGGMTSDELLAIIEQDETSLDAVEKLLLPIISNRVAPKMIAELEAILPQLQQLAEKTAGLYETRPLVAVLSESLALAVEEAREIGKPAPITIWKSQWIGKNENKEAICKDRERLAKLKALSFIYYEYLRRMEAAGLYDYDDMILQVVHAMEVYPDLRATLQERYLYLMVDEFQDTNIAQMRILHSLTDNEVNEGAPNILAVGDDDQAVYGFQGADVSNMLHFREKYPTAQLIVLTHNYRSGVTILDASRQIIVQGTDRLERRIPEIDKVLASQRTEPGEVKVVAHGTAQAERQWVVEQIRQTRETDKKKGVATRIAVLARKHEDLQLLLPYFDAADVPVRYEKQDNALEQPPIIALEQLARVVVALAKGRHGEVNALLPELLAHPAWGIAPVDLWKLSLQAYESRRTWMTEMATTPAFTAIHELLTAYALESKTRALEPMLDLLMGKTKEGGGPLFDYFFGEAFLQEQPERYLEYLNALRIIRTKLHEYRTEKAATLETFVEFVDTYRRLGLVITTPRQSLGDEEEAVDLLTAHKAKGLEFDHVYVIHSIDGRWGQSARHRSRAIGYPENLPLAPAGDTADERLRLFYVAMTRAKTQLVMSYADRDDKERAVLPADFLVATTLAAEHLSSPTISESIAAAEIAWYHPLTTVNKDLATVLGPRLDTYRLSATALTSFLDISKGGPQAFLLYHLLGIPQASSPAIAYGNAVHRALQQAHTHMGATGEQRPLEDTLHDFEQALQRERLDEQEYAVALQKGSEQLPVFLASPLISFHQGQKPELPFAHQEVQLGDARLTGKLDLAAIDTTTKTMVITDYKTGKPALGWKGKDEYEKRKLHHYRQQLIFYALLVAHSRDYHQYEVTQGNIAFVQPTKSGEICVLDMTFSSDEIARVTALIEVVWRHISTLSFPDTSAYPETLAGMIAFEDDLIDGKI